jgi:hypothetical protein
MVLARLRDLAFTTALTSAVHVAALAVPAPSDKKYVDDYDFLVATVRKDAAAIQCKKLDWDALSKPFRARFEKCTSDVDHVKNVMALLATLQDSHTGVLDTKVDAKQLPSKFDGLFGGGLWFGWEGGKFVLRGVMEGHTLAASAPLGSVLTKVGDEPAWFAMARERRRIAAFQGISTDASLFSSLGNKLLPFGDAKQIAIEIVTPDGKTKRLDVPRWGPNGKAFYPGPDLLPETTPPIAWVDGGAVSGFLSPPSCPWSQKVGFLKITGEMNAATVKAFDAAFDALKGMDALLLDCRGMGGGSDDCAWTMCGRLFSKGADNGSHGKLGPNGSWQFDGPVVMLQDENEVSSAETFTWALSETGRVVSVGRATGGWGIIPKHYELPSGLAAFRLGTNDRATPIKGIHTEGVGWPADVTVPFGPKLVEYGGGKTPDPVRALGLDVLNVLHAGANLGETRAAFHALAEGDVAAFKAFAKKVAGAAAVAAKAKGFDGEKLAKLFDVDLALELALEVAAIEYAGDDLPPDALGLTRRAPRLLARAKAEGVKVGALETWFKKLAPEAAAQEALLRAVDDSFQLSDDAKKAFLAKHGATKTGKYVRARDTK